MSKFLDELQKVLGEHEPEEIEELVLDDLWENKDELTEDEKNALEEYTNLIHLSLNNIGFKSLNNFPYIKNLYMLSLNNNKLNGDDFNSIKNLYPYLHKLRICNNNIENIKNFSKLNILSLNKLEVKDNPFTLKNKEYKEEIFQMIENLKAIDNEDENGEHVESTDYHNEEEENEEDEEYEEEEKEKNEEENDDNEKNNNFKDKNKKRKQDENSNNNNNDKEDNEEEDEDEDEEEDEDA